MPTTIVCLLAGGAGHVVLWVAWSFEWRVPWQPVAGLCLTVVSVAAFGGFYVASRRARIAISTGATPGDIQRSDRDLVGPAPPRRTA